MSKIKGSLLNFLNSYLKDRSQATVIINVVSQCIIINVRIPQGLCLGPLFFFAQWHILCTSFQVGFRSQLDVGSKLFSRFSILLILNEFLNKRVKNVFQN